MIVNKMNFDEIANDHLDDDDVLFVLYFGKQNNDMFSVDIVGEASWPPDEFLPFRLKEDENTCHVTGELSLRGLYDIMLGIQPLAINWPSNIERTYYRK